MYIFLRVLRELRGKDFSHGARKFALYREADFFSASAGSSRFIVSLVFLLMAEG
jgi:hypothetical protein